MCVSAAPAEFSGTIVYVGRHTHPEHGPVEVLGYQNTAVNLAHGPNAMLLHLPAAGMSSTNFLDTGDTPYILRDLVNSLRPAPWAVRAGGPAPDGPPPRVEVFDHDVYTVVLAADPAAIPAALEQVPPRKRPDLGPELFRFYADMFPGYPVALCCFDNADARRAAPLLMWYRPIFADRLTAPALDAHSGAPPDPDALVRPDHWVLFGLDDPPDGWGVPVWYRRAPGPLAPFLPRRVIGREVTGGQVRNGDFVISLADARAGRIDRLGRLTAKGEQVPLTPAPATEDGPATSRPWLRPVLTAVALVLVVVFCSWFLIWGP
jgi:hypothetical protein